MKGGLLLNRTRQVPAEDSAAFAGIAERFRRAGDLDRAITLCRDGLRKFPTLLSARVTLGWALLDSGQYDEARAELEQVLRRAPDNLAAIRGLAELHDRHMAPLGDPSWQQQAAADAAGAMPEAEAPSPVFAVAAALDEPIKLPHFDFSTPADAPVEFETSGRASFDPAAFEPVTFEVESSLDVAALDASPEPVRIEQPSDLYSTASPFVVDSDPVPVLSNSDLSALDPVLDPALEAGAGPSEDEVGTGVSEDIDFGDAQFAEPVATPRRDAVVTLPASGDLELDALASAFSVESLDAGEPAVELASGGPGVDTMIAELQAFGLEGLRVESPTLVEAAETPAPEPVIEPGPEETTDVVFGASSSTVPTPTFDLSRALELEPESLLASAAPLEAEAPFELTSPVLAPVAEHSTSEVPPPAFDLPAAPAGALAFDFEATPVPTLTGVGSFPVTDGPPPLVAIQIAEERARQAERAARQAAVVAALGRFSRQAQARRLELDARSVA